MSYCIEYMTTPDYVHATVTGENSPDSVKGYLAEVYRYCKEHAVERVLIEENLDGERLEALEVFAIASEGSMRALGWFEAVAYVDPRMGDMGEFAETVAVNRGMPVAVFDSVEKAAEWLRSQRGGSRERYIFIDGDSSKR